MSQEIEIIVDDERRAGNDARQAASILERKRAALQAELEDARALLETVCPAPFFSVFLSY